MSLGTLKPRSNAATIRRLLPEIEKALNDGASRHDVYEALKSEYGVKLSFLSFEKALQRERARVRATHHDSGLHNPQKEGQNSSSIENGEPTAEAKTHKPEQGKKMGILKKGEFAPQEGFDPKEYDPRY